MPYSGWQRQHAVCGSTNQPQGKGASPFGPMDPRALRRTSHQRSLSPSVNDFVGADGERHTWWFCMTTVGLEPKPCRIAKGEGREIRTGEVPGILLAFVPSAGGPFPLAWALSCLLPRPRVPKLSSERHGLELPTVSLGRGRPPCGPPPWRSRRGCLPKVSRSSLPNVPAPRIKSVERRS